VLLLLLLLLLWRLVVLLWLLRWLLLARSLRLASSSVSRAWLWCALALWLLTRSLTRSFSMHTGLYCTVMGVLRGACQAEGCTGCRVFMPAEATADDHDGDGGPCIRCGHFPHQHMSGGSDSGGDAEVLSRIDPLGLLAEGTAAASTHTHTPTPTHAHPQTSM